MGTLLDILGTVPHAALDLLLVLWVAMLSATILRNVGRFGKALTDIDTLKAENRESKVDRKQTGERVSALETRLELGFERNSDQHEAIEEKVDLGNERSGRIQADLGALRGLFEQWLMRDKQRNGG